MGGGKGGGKGMIRVGSGWVGRAGSGSSKGKGMGGAGRGGAGRGWAGRVEARWGGTIGAGIG